MSTIWKNEIEYLSSEVSKGRKLESLAIEYQVSKQRLYQVLTKFGVSTPIRTRKNFLRDKSEKHYWLNKMLGIKGVKPKDRLELLETLVIPDYCPALGIELNYLGVEDGSGWTRKDNSPSIDRIDSSKGYTKDNIQILSWRANRIKNDSTVEELVKLAAYMQSLDK